MSFLFVDRILHLSSPTGSVCGIKHITPSDYYLSSVSTERPYFMPALIGETLGQLTAWAAMAQNDFRLRPVAGIVESATMYRPAYVGETLELESWIDTLDDTALQYHGEVRIGKELIFQLEGALGPMLPMADFIDPVLVRKQFMEINRPGAWPYVPAMPPLITAKTESDLLLQFDHIIAIEPGVSMRAVKHVSRAAPYFPDHFPHKPVLPLTVLLECSMNLAKEFLQQADLNDQYRIHKLRRIKMSDFVYPGDVVNCDLNVKHQDAHELILRYQINVAGKRVCLFEIVLLAKGE
ncbi:MAG: hydroxymyristoyl-ACP dehydratase [Gammaproteobacteria bacterium]